MSIVGKATPDPTRLTPEAYLRHLDRDVHALVAAATDMEARVPGCPDWNVRDLLSHVIGVYRHKVAALVSGAAPEPPTDGDWGSLDEGADPRSTLVDAYAELRPLLDVPPETSAWSWWPPEQTVGFWQRRMALETVVHRWDAESATGAGGRIDRELADDGSDELLGWLTWDWTEVPQTEALGQAVVVASPARAWRVRLHVTSVEVERCDPTAGDAAATIAGDPTDLFLHLWGRPVAGPVTGAGDPLALRLLRERLSMATT